MTSTVPSPTASVHRRRSVSGSGQVDRGSPWWLWPHLLSLDAPLVAVLWQRWWARAAGETVPWVHMVILGAGVWMIYLADRVADTARCTSGGHSTARHSFYRNHRRIVLPVVGTVFCGLAWFALRFLTLGQFLAGLGLLALAGGYFWAVHYRTRRGCAVYLPKEASVGGMFMAGTAFFVIGGWEGPILKWGSAVLMFGGLCFLNCALITKWERSPVDLRDPSSLLNAFPRLTARLGAGCVILAGLSSVAMTATPHGRVFAPIALSALLLAGLEWRKDLFSTDGLRVLADVALLTPCVLWQ